MASRPKPRPLLTEQLNIRLAPGDRETLHKLANSHKLTLAEWVRIKIFEPRPMSVVRHAQQPE